VTKSIGKGVPDHTDRKRAKIKSNAAKNIRFPINILSVNLMHHPIPNANYV